MDNEQNTPTPEKKVKEPKAKKEPKPKKEKPEKKKRLLDRAWDSLAAIGRKPWFRIAEIVLATLLVVMLVFYGSAMLFGEKSGFSVSIAKDDKSKGAISLSDSKDFKSPVVRLSAAGAPELNNISVLDLPETFECEGGSHNGENYLAYTFYMKNSGNATADIRSELEIKSALNGAEDAIRVRVYKNGIHTTYAMLGADGRPEHDTTPFYEDRKIFSLVEEDVKQGEIIKYTFVVWLEGDDPECLDNIKGGNVKMSLTFSVDNAET